METQLLAVSPLSEQELKLIKAAYRVMAQRGSHRFILDDVARAAGCSKGTVLYYFKTKEDLVLATIRWALSRVAERIRRYMENSPDGLRKLEAMLDAIFIGPEANRQFYLIYLDLLSHGARNKRFRELGQTFRTIVEGLFAEVIRNGITEGIFRDVDPENGAKIVRAIIDGIFIQWLQESDDRKHQEYKARCYQAFLDYLTR